MYVCDKLIKDKVFKIYYNKGYDCYVYITGNNLPIITYNKKVLKPFIRKSNTRLVYPAVNIGGKIQYCHRIVAFACLDMKSYYTMLKECKDKDKIVVDHFNGNTLDYHIDNLHFMYHKDNIKFHDGYMKPVK